MRRRYKKWPSSLLFLILFGIGLGYAFLNSNLNISGVTGLLNSTWNIYWDNIVFGENNVTDVTTPATISSNKTEVSFNVNFSKPGDTYEFTVDAVNDGSVDGMVESFTNKVYAVNGVTEKELPEYLEFTVSYSDGTVIHENDLLAAHERETYKVRVHYKEDVDSTQLPSTADNYLFKFSITYAQADENVKEIDRPTLYNVLKKAAKEGTYAKEYTGEHHDSFTEEPSQKIYHWYADNDSDGTAILDKNNVIFANHCWQMIRTTDTGGVKMIYNGEVEDGKCLNTRGNHVGYAARTTQSMSTTYYYGTDYTYDKTNNVFSLSGTTSTGEIKVGEYTCKSASADGTCATLYLVDTLSSGTNYYVLQLNGNSHYSQFGTLQFNQQTSSPADVGYMYNTRYTYYPTTVTSTETMLSSTTLSTTYWYANSVTWGSPTANTYNLNNPYQVSAISDYPNLVGKYTFRNTTQTYTSTGVYYIAAVNYTTMYYIWLSNSGNHRLSNFNYTYTYGDSYTDNGDGTYTINNPTTINRSDWFTSYNYSKVKNKYVCKNAANNTCSDLWYAVKTSNTDMLYIKVADNYKYSKGFTWDGSKYVLDNDTSVTFWNINDSTNKASINNAHYTCWNESGECESISYIYYITSYPESYYIKITNGKSVGDALNEMLYNDNVNTKNSTIKTGIDAWYRHFLLKNDDDYIEDTIYCNDRSQSNADTNGWNPNGGSTLTYLHFHGTSDLSCPNNTDKFSISNNKAKLTYKVGLMSSPEMKLLNNLNAQKTGKDYWLGSSSGFESRYAYGGFVNIIGYSSSDRVDKSSYGLRPSISLKPGTRYSDGNGSMADPYVVES